MQNPEIQSGLQKAGFVSLPYVTLNLQPQPAQDAIGLVWDASAGRTYQVEYSTDLNAWFASPTGEVLAGGPTATWTDNGPLATSAKPYSVPKRFYRVFQFGSP